MLEVPHAKASQRVKPHSSVLTSQDDLLGKASQQTVNQQFAASCQQLRPVMPSVLTDQTHVNNQFQRQDNSFPAYQVNVE